MCCELLNITQGGVGGALCPLSVFGGVHHADEVILQHAIDDGSLSPVKMASFKGLPQLMLKNHGVDIFIRLLNGCCEALQKTM